MSRVIDNRVVEMEFDNANFEKNVGTSLSTLDKLKAALSFKGVNTNFDSVEGSAISLGKSFSILEQMAIGAFRSMGDSVASWATRTIKEMSGVSNMINGFKKFSTITTSAATLNAQGFDTKDVEKQLERLNWFTDETSYNLSDMVDNISKFTATGQSLEDSSDAMMGIALWAAMSGQNAQTASRAMYQLSQAMAGFMKREDWRSIQNANMDTKEFREHALEAAVAVGTLKKNSQGLYMSTVEGIKKADKVWFSRDKFVESLTGGQWFTKDVMMSVYREYASAVNQIYDYTQKHVGSTVDDALEAIGDSLSEFGRRAFEAGQKARTWEDAVNSVTDALSTKWMGVFKLIFGNAEEATDFFTDLSYSFYDLFVEPMNDTLASLQKWNEKLGGETLREGILNVLESILNVANMIRDAFDDIFFGDEIEKVQKEFSKESKMLKLVSEELGEEIPTMEDEGEAKAEVKARGFMRITQAFKDWSDKLLENSENLTKFSTVVKGVAAIIDIVKEAFGGLFSVLKDLFSGGGKLGEVFLDIGSKIGMLFIKLDSAIKNANFFKNAFQTILQPLFNLKQAIKDFFALFTPEFLKRWDNFKSRLSGLDLGLLKSGGVVDGFFSKLKSKWTSLFTNFDAQKAVDGIFNAVDRIQEAFYKLIGVTNDDEFFDWVNKKIEGISNGTKNLWTTMSGIFDSIKGFAKNFWEGITGFFNNEDGESGLKKVLDIFKEFGKTLGTILGWLVKGLQPLLDGLKNTLSNLSLEGAGDLLKGGGIAALGAALFEFVRFRIFKFKPVVNAFKAVLDSLSGVLDGFAYSLDAKALKDAAIAIAVLVASILILVSIPPDKMASAATVIGVLLAIMIKSLKGVSQFESSIGLNSKGLNVSKSSAGGTMLKLAASLLVIALAMKMLASIPEDDLYKAAGVIGLMIGIMALAVTAISKLSSLNNSKLPVTNVGLINKYSLASKNSLVKVGGPAATIFAMGIFIAAIVLATKQFVNLIKDDEKSFYISIALVGALLVALGAFLGIMAKLYKTTEDKGLSQGPSATLWKNILAISTGIYIIALAINKLSKVALKIAEYSTSEGANTDVLIGFGIFVIAFLGMVAAIMKASGNIKGEEFKTFVKGLTTIAAAVLIVAATAAGLAYAFEGKNLQTLIAVGAAIVVISAVFAGLALLSKSEKIDPKKMADISKALIIFSASILVASAALYALSQIDSKDFLKTIGFLAAIVASMAIIGYLSAGSVGDGLLKFGLTIEYLAIAVAALSVGLLAAAVALKIFLEDLELLSNKDLKEKFRIAASNIDAYVNEIIDRSGTWVFKILKSVLEVALALIPAAISAIVDTIVKTLNALMEKDPVTGKMKIEVIVDRLLEIIIIIIKGINKYIAQITGAVADLLVDIIDSLGDWIQNNSDRVSKALDKVVGGLISIILHLFDPLGEQIFGDAWNDVVNAIETIAKPALLVFAGAWLVKTFVPAVLAALNPITVWILGALALIALLAKAIGAIKSFMAGGEKSPFNETKEEIRARRKRLHDYVYGKYHNGKPSTEDELLDAKTYEDNLVSEGWDVGANGELINRFAKKVGSSNLASQYAKSRTTSTTETYSKYQRTKNGTTEYLDTGSDIRKYKYTPYDADVAAFKPSQQGKNGGNSATVNYTQVNNMGNQVSTTDLFRQAKTTVGDMFTFDFSGLLGGENTGDIDKIIQKYGISGG